MIFLSLIELIVKNYNFVISHKLEMIVILYENIKVTKNTKLVGAWASHKLYFLLILLLKLLFSS